jgi:predicted Zn-ribbon and HTH transcriptional regulator
MKCKCKRCGYEWLARTESPKQCPYCKRYITIVKDDEGKEDKEK